MIPGSILITVYGSRRADARAVTVTAEIFTVSSMKLSCAMEGRERKEMSRNATADSGWRMRGVRMI
jgi:hypothetical protein